MKKILMNSTAKKVTYIIILLCISLLSIFVVSKYASAPQNYKSTIQSIDEKKTMITGISAAAATTSALIAALPGDSTTPIANQIIEISSYLMIVVCMLVLEKSLLTVTGYLAFKILIPIACVLLGVYTFFKSKALKILALKFIAASLVMVTIIPFGIKISDLVYETNKVFSEETLTEFNDNIREQSDIDNSETSNITEKSKEIISAVGTTLKTKVSTFIDTVALFIIAYCIIPIIILLSIIWFIKYLFNIKLPDFKPSKIFELNNQDK